jgi:TonB dependent receptor/Carboxypeptidase regulatory-like domain
MEIRTGPPAATRMGRTLARVLAACILLPLMAAGQGLTGTLIGTVKDERGGVLVGARVRINSPALIGGPMTVLTDDKGQMRFPALPPGAYALEIELRGFTTYHEQDIRIGTSATIERTAKMKLAGVAESVVVEGTGSRIETRDPGFATRFGLEDLRAIPTRRSSMFDWIRATPGISPTSPSSGTVNTASAFGSGTNENTFHIDGTNFTCPCNGAARSEPGVDFIQEIQVQSVGASAEFGNMQGAVINVVTRQGGARFLYDASYYGQTAGLTSQPVRLPIQGAGQMESGYSRARYRDFTTSFGGPAIREHLWFFTGYHHLRDYDSQPGSDPKFPRTYEQDKILAKLTWSLAPGWQLVQSFYDESWVSPEQPTVAKPFDATYRRTASVPAMTFGHLNHTLSTNTVWDARVGQFIYAQEDGPSSGDRTRPGRFDSVTGSWSGAPTMFGGPTLTRLTAKATVSHYRPGLLGGDHQWKVGGQVERGEHHSAVVIPTGQRFVDVGGEPSEVISSPPSHIGGVFITAAGFATDAITLKDRLTIHAGVRFDHSRAISQDLPAIDSHLRETDEIVGGLGTLYTWNEWSPRLGMTTKLSADGRTMLRGSYGRFTQGVLTGEIQPFHPGAAKVTTTAFDRATGGYTGPSREVDPRINLLLDRNTRAPRTDEFSLGVDREVGRRLAVAVAYVRKDGSDFIGWTDVGGAYRDGTRTLADGRTLPVRELVNGTAARRFLLTNPNGYSLTYRGLVMVVEKRRARGWQAFGSYSLSKASGLQPSSGTNAAGAQASTVAPAPAGLTFGRDPNDLTHARGRLPNDRPHIFRFMGSVDVPRSGFVVAANLQHFSGKPWAATAMVSLPQTGNQPTQRVLLEPRGSRRLSAQSLLDLRVSRTVRFGGVGSVDLLVDVLNVLNDTAEEALATDNLFSPNFGQPTVFMDPRRAMFSVRMSLGR